jgi:hypothetical protein
MAMRSPKWFVLAALVALSPETPGVFELWDNDELVYVRATGDKQTLRTELARELAAHVTDATHFSWEITYQPERRERQLLDEFEHQYHRRPRFNS